MGQKEIFPFGVYQMTFSHQKGQVLQSFDGRDPEHFVQGVMGGGIELIMFIQGAIEKGDAMAYGTAAAFI